MIIMPFITYPSGKMQFEQFYIRTLVIETIQPYKLLSLVLLLFVCV